MVKHGNELKIGVRYELNKSLNAFDYITYCGMPNPETFCVTKETQVYRGDGSLTASFSCPLFFPINTQAVFGQRIVEVNTEKLILEARL